MRNSLRACAWAVAFTTVICAGPALADGHITTCDRLAAHPEDPDKVVAGVPTADVDLPAAITACEAEVEADPTDMRATYQLARVYFYAGRSAEAVATMEKAAEGGYRQAQFVMGALISNNRPDASDDICDAERWWFESAKNGRLAAQVSYVRHVTKGLFDGCTLHGSVKDMTGFLDNVRANESDYYLRLLVADLTEDLNAYRAR
jgi:TPR repeat protein